MTGPDHYREAESLLKYAAEHGGEYGETWRAGRIAEAQVHATLALAAATVEPTALWTEALR